MIMNTSSWFANVCILSYDDIAGLYVSLDFVMILI